jgi:hypothetical protein
MTEPTTYTGAQLMTALDTTEQRIYQAAGDNGVDDVFYDIKAKLPIFPERSYTRDEFTAMLNAAADEVTDFDYEDSHVIWTQDVANLTVNCAGYLADHPGAELDDVIAASYADDFGEDDLDFDDLPEDAEIPAKGSPAWNAALTEKVCGWVS